MLDRFNRSNFYKDEVADVLETDLLTNSINQFQFAVDYNIYTVTEEDITRPDLISFKIYRNVTYWWILMKFNGIHDIWNDLSVGQILKYPPITEMDKFYNFNANRK